MDIDHIWRKLEDSISRVENGFASEGEGISDAMESVIRLLEFSPREVLDQIKRSGSPHKAMITRLLYEAGKVDGSEEESKDTIQNLLKQICLQECRPDGVPSTTGSH